MLIRFSIVKNHPSLVTRTPTASYALGTSLAEGGWCSIPHGFKICIDPFGSFSLSPATQELPLRGSLSNLQNSANHSLAFWERLLQRGW